MKKEILLSIAGLHMIEEEDGNVEVVTAGDYYNRNGKHYVVYDEVVEGLSGHISNTSGPIMSATMERRSG